MKIKMLKLAASPQGALEAGRTYEVPPARAQALLDAGAAVAVDQPRRTVRERLAGRKKPAEQREPAQDKPLDKHTIEQLRELAAERGIDLGEATKKAQIIQVIQEADAEDDGDDDGGGE